MKIDFITNLREQKSWIFHVLPLILIIKVHQIMIDQRKVLKWNNHLCSEVIISNLNLRNILSKSSLLKRQCSKNLISYSSSGQCIYPPSPQSLSIMKVFFSRFNGPLNMQTLDIMISQKISTFCQAVCHTIDFSWTILFFANDVGS